MPNTTNPNPSIHPKTTSANPSGHAPSAPFPPKSPDTRPDSTTVKDPKKTGSSANRVERVADKAAHKAAKDEQEYDKQNTTISH